MTPGSASASATMPAMVELLPVSFRFDPETKELLDALSAQLGVNRVGVMRMALRQLARREGVTVGAPAPKTRKKRK